MESHIDFMGPAIDPFLGLGVACEVKMAAPTTGHLENGQVWHMPDVMHWDAVSYAHSSMHASRYI